MGKNAGITNKLFLAMAVIVVTSILLVTPGYAGENNWSIRPGHPGTYQRERW